MAYTPKKSVHWNQDNSPSDFGSPSVGDDSTESVLATSSLEYVNSQLVAHGFVPAPGLCLDGASGKDSERAVKCLLSLLGQRMQDMSRTEELSTKLRTLSYDHQRLTSMHRSALETAANAERETNLHKSKLASTQRSLQSAEAAHKQTSLELQRTKTSLQAVRTAHQTELKKKEKEFERMSEKWQKLTDIQTKLSTTPSGISCANVSAVEGRINTGADYLDVALDEAERARAALADDNKHLKTLVLKAVNSIQRIVYQTKALLTEPSDGPPYPFTTVTLFPMASSSTPNEKLTNLLSELRDTLETVSERLAAPPLATSRNEDTTSASNGDASDEEIQQLKLNVTRLQGELARCQRRLDTQSEEMQTMLDTIAEQQLASASELGEISVELMSIPLRDEERERLDRLQQDLESERKKFTEAAVRFGRDKAALEAQRSQFLEEKRSWEVEKVLSGRSSTPEPAPVISGSPPRLAKILKESPRKASFRSPKKSSPRKSPAKHVVGRKGHKSKPSLSSSSKIIPAFETEVLPSFARLSTLAPPNSLMLDAFVLPPPSPRASLPSNPALPPAGLISPPDFSSHPKEENPLALAPQKQQQPPTTPEPARRPFPVAKPFAQRMVHAYSPAKPSPLSRILMLADTPANLPPLPELSMVSEEYQDDYQDEMDLSPSGGSKPMFTLNPPEEEEMSLAAQLGVSESPPDTPLQEKKIEANVAVPSRIGGMKGRVLFPDSKKSAVASKDKGKAKATSTLPNSTLQRGRTSASLEKENDAKKVKTTTTKVSPVFKPPPKITVASAKAPARPSISGVPSSRAAATARGPTKAPPAASGPRRVPIDSDEAPTVVRRIRT